MEFPSRYPLVESSTCVTLAWGIEMGLREGTSICAPKAVFDKAYPMFKNYLYENRHSLSGTAASAYSAMLKKNFPCR